MKSYGQRGGSLALLILLAVWPATAEQQQQQEEQPQQAQGAEAPPVDPQMEALQSILQTIEPQQRLELVETFLAQYPESPYRPNVYLAAAEAHRMLNHYDQAAEFGERALEINPRDPLPMLLIADSLSEGAQPTRPDYEEKMSKAEEYSRQALSLLPELFASVPRRPEVPEEEYRLREQYVEAQAHATLGYIYLRRKDYTAAEEELKLATELNQLRPNAADFERLGVVQVERQKYEEARAAFERCRDLGGIAFQTCQQRLELLNEMIQRQKTSEQGQPQG